MRYTNLLLLTSNGSRWCIRYDRGVQRGLESCVFSLIQHMQPETETIVACRNVPRLQRLCCCHCQSCSYDNTALTRPICYIIGSCCFKIRKICLNESHIKASVRHRQIKLSFQVTTAKQTRSQAVARIADRTASQQTLTFRENYLCARSAFRIQSCMPNLKPVAQVAFEILSSKRIGVTSLTFQRHVTSSVA